MKSEILLRGASNSDIRYFTGASTADGFFAFSLNGKRCALLSALEIDKMRRHSRLDKLFDLADVCKKFGVAGQPYAEHLALSKLLKAARVRELLVPSDFPALSLQLLSEEGFKIRICEGQIFPERAVKGRAELSLIEKANEVASAGFAVAEEILRRSTIRGKYIYYAGEILTSQFLRAEIEKIALSLGADAVDTIASSGAQACMPHEVGHGAVAPNSLIVIDIFPKLREGGYFGDMTRTFLKGAPTVAQAKLVETVLSAQELGVGKIRAGINGADVHAAVADFLSRNGYETSVKKGSWRGFFHSTGHGIGLDVHEEPSLGRRDCVLECGNVVTVEPGLYYPEIGGCRIEDNVVVLKNGCRMLSKYHYNWVID